MPVRHSVVVTRANNSSSDVSKDAWNADHEGATGRAADVIVARSSASDDDKADADYVLPGTADQVTLLTAINSLDDHGAGSNGTKTGSLKVVGSGNINFSGLLDLPPFEDADIDFGPGNINGGGIRFDSSMSSVFRIGVMAGRTSNIGIDIAPRTAGPDGLVTFPANRVLIRGIAGVSAPYPSGGCGLRLHPAANKTIDQSLFEIGEIIGYETGILAEASVFSNVFNVEFIHGSTQAIQEDGVQNMWRVMLGENNTYGFKANGSDSVINFSAITNPDANSVVFGSGALRYLVTAPGSMTGWTDNSGNLTNRVITPRAMGSGNSSGTGAQQTIAHGLCFTPRRDQIALFAGSATANPYHSAAPDATNIYVTAASGQAWYWARVN